MECIISHDAEEAISVFVGDPLELSRRDAEDFGGFFQYLADVRARRDTRPYHGIGLDKETIEGDLLHERAVVHGVVVKDCGADRDETVQLYDVRDQSIRAREAVKEKSCEL